MYGADAWRIVRSSHQSPGVYDGRIVYCHWHAEWEWLFVEAGDVHVEIEGERRLLHAGEGALVNRDEIHRAWTEPEVPATPHAMVQGNPHAPSCPHPPAQVLAFVFDLGMFREDPSGRIADQVICPLQEGRRALPRWLSRSVPWQRELLAMLQGTCRNVEASPERRVVADLAVHSGLLGMLRVIEQASAWTERQVPSGTKRGAVRPVLAYIEDHLDEALPVRQLAERAYTSEKHFFRIFRGVTGMTPNAYIHARRIARAEQLLGHTDMPIGVVAGMVGYDSPSRFIQVFRIHKGMTPARFRHAVRG